MRSTRALITVLGLVVSVTHADAQQVPPGTRVRLTTPAAFTGWHVGRVTSVTGDSVRIVYATGDSAVFALATVGLMDASGGTHTPLWAMLSSVVTVPVGAAIGLVGGMFVDAAERRGLGSNAGAGASVGAVGGLIVGVVIATTHKSEEWKPVMLPARATPLASNPREDAVDATTYRPRVRLKLRVAGRNVVGTLVEQRDDSVVLAWNSAHTSYSLATVSDVRVSRGKSAWTGAQFGALVGAGIGVLTAARDAVQPNDINGLRDSDCDTNTTSCRYDSDLVAASRTVGGYALLGALTGAVIRRERWVRGELPQATNDPEPPRLLLAPDGRGVRFGIHATF